MKLLVWYHPFAKTHPLTNTTLQCLLRKHGVITVVELVKLTKKLNTQQWIEEHTPSYDCMCHDCSEDRMRGCLNPHTCVEEALKCIHNLALKYNPLEIGEHNNLSLMH